MTDVDLAHAVDQALDDCRIQLGPRTRAAFIARLIELLEEAGCAVVTRSNTSVPNWRMNPFSDTDAEGSRPRVLVDWPPALSSLSHLLWIKRACASGGPAEVRRVVDVRTGREIPAPPRRPPATPQRRSR